MFLRRGAPDVSWPPARCGAPPRLVTRPSRSVRCHLDPVLHRVLPTCARASEMEWVSGHCAGKPTWRRGGRSRRWTGRTCVVRGLLGTGTGVVTLRAVAK